METRQPDGILRKLTDAGFAAYYVGGCVRDRLLNRPVHDWDITTAALPEQVQALFAHCVPTGLRHGTVTVFHDGAQAEITTFRAEGAYLDARHPSEVRFVRRLEDDLARRDFTVNAMAMDLLGNIIDLFGGREDLAAGVLRCVGEPKTRFEEDALRMLRAYRFCAQLGFHLEVRTEQAASVCAPLAGALSMERLCEEAEKTLLSPQPEFLGVMAAQGLLRAAGIEALPPLSWLASLPAQREIRWAGLKVLYPALSPERLRLPSRLCALITRGAAGFQPEPDRPALKRCIADNGWDAAEVTAALCGAQTLLADIRASGECVTLAQLAVSGRDLPQLHGPEVGAALRRLLRHVLLHPEDNQKDILLALLCGEAKKSSSRPL